MAKEEQLEFPGVVTELLPNATFRVKLENEHELIAHAAGRVRKDVLDPFAMAAMLETGIDITQHEPTTIEELEDLEGLDFDLIVTLSPEAHHTALALTHRIGAVVEYWPTADPTATEGNREQRLDAYRAVRDQLTARIKTRFF